MASCTPEINNLPKFSPQTRVIVRGSNEHEHHAYQYATTSQKKGTMEPAVIIYPKNVQTLLHRYITPAKTARVLLYAQEDSSILVRLRHLAITSS